MQMFDSYRQLGLASAMALLSAAGGLAAAAFPAPAYAVSVDAADSVAPSTAPALQPLRVGLRTAPPDAQGRYSVVVRFREPALASYEGGIAGLEATAPRVRGESRLDPRSPASLAYLDHLAARQADYLDAIGDELRRGVSPQFQYLHALNGVALRLTLDEAEKLRGLDFVRSVHLDELHEPTTDTGPDFIGAPAFWNGNTTSGNPRRGEGMVIGIIDSGFVHSHPSFAQLAPGDGHVHVNPLGDGVFLGLCLTTPGLCNNKLIGSYNFHPNTSVSEDTSGHGTHVASTAGGNPVDASFNGLNIPISGVAPRANLINYRVCFPTCPTTSSVAAVNQAINDGIVDVINFSISGSDNPWNDIVDLAFLDAFNAGIYVSASAGNSGPGASTVAHTGPWNATVANSTHNRVFGFDLDLTGPAGAPPNTQDITVVPGGAPINLTDVVDRPIVQSPTFANGGTDGCSAFPPGTFEVGGTGAVAVLHLDALTSACPSGTRRTNALAAGAFGVIFVDDQFLNLGASGTSWAMRFEDWNNLEAHIDTDPANATVSISGTLERRISGSGDVLNATSSRGPSQFDVMAPDIAAPGTQILAAYYSNSASPVYGAISGTSMASPHSAGSAALVMQENPSWSPAAVKSAIALTAQSNMLKEDGLTSSDPFDRGSGRVNLTDAALAPLVMDESGADFAAADPGSGGQPRDLNLPALVDGDCQTTCSFTRAFTSVLGSSEDYTISTTAPPGVTIVATPDAFTLAAGSTQEVDFLVTFDFNVAAENAWAFGSVGIASVNPALPDMGMPVALFGVPPLPVIGVSPASVTQVQNPESTSERSFRIGNTGGSDLDWAFIGAPPPAGLLQANQSKSLRTAVVDATGVSGITLGPSAQGGKAPAQSASLEKGAGTTTLTHSVSQSVSASGSVACTQTGTSFTVENRYLRAFTLSDFGIVSDFEASSVRFGIQNLTTATNITVNLYQLPPGNDFVYGNLNLVGSAAAPVTPQAQALVDVPVTGSVTAGSTLVVEVVSPDLSGSSAGFFVGSNAAGQSGPSFIAAAGCGINEPVDLDAIGFPNMHIVMNVSGSFTQSCAHPDDVSWLTSSADSGTIPNPGFQDVILGLDSSGLSAGAYTANLCIGSNDTANPTVVVPVTLDVNAVPRVALSESALSASVVVGGSASSSFDVQNVGDADLSWSIETASGVVQQKVIGASGLLYDNGPFITGPGTGAAAAFQASLVQNASLGLTLLGAGVQPVAPGPHNRIADNFTVADPSGWQVETLRFFGYQTGSSTTSTFTGVNLRIWDGPPNVGGSQVVFGDTTTNRIAGTGFTGVVRYSEITIGVTRPIMFVDATVDTVLPPGTYWVDWQLAGSLASGPWQPPVTRITERITGNALQLVEAGWQALIDGNLLTPQGAPFQVNGQSAGVCASPQAFPWLSVSPLSGITAVGASSTVTVDMDATGMAPGVYEARVCVQNDDPTTSAIPFVDVSLEVLAPSITLDPATLPDGQVGQAYSASVSATSVGATEPFSFDWSGDIPAGLSIDASGNISGTPTAAGSFSVTVTATDSTDVGSGGPFQGSQVYTIDISPPVITVTPDLLPLAVVGQAVAAQMQASGTGAVEPFSFAVTDGALPAGLSLNTDGSFDGAPTEAGNFVFTVTASDATDAGSGGPFTGSVEVTLSVVEDSEFIFFDGFETIVPGGLKVVLDEGDTQVVTLALGGALSGLDPASGSVSVGEIVSDQIRTGLLQARCHGNGCEVRVVFLADPQDVWAGDWLPVTGAALSLQFVREDGRLVDAQPVR